MNMVSPATAMYTARAVGTASISLLAGAMLSNNAFIMPALFQTPTLSPKDRMMMLNRLFNNGKRLIVPLLLTSILSLSLASYCFSAPISSDATPGLLPWISSHRRTTLGWSAFLVFLNLPYTGIFVLSGVKALAEAERQEHGGADASVDTDASLMQN